MKKIEYYAGLIGAAGFLRCPCGMSISPDGQTLRCGNNHCFDISAKGTVNFCANTKVSRLYENTLFEERTAIFMSGFFAPLYDRISELTENITGVTADMGCGEGSGLRHVLKKTKARLGVAADLSKDAIKQGASGEMERILWLVADLAHLPLEDNSVDCLLNVLSPAAYGEFDRVLKPNGILIKVIPDDIYLRELRDFFHGGRPLKNDAETLFKSRYTLFSEETIRYDFPVNSRLLRHLVRMTPLTKNASEYKINSFVDSGITSITAGFKILSRINREE